MGQKKIKEVEDKLVEEGKPEVASPTETTEEVKDTPKKKSKNKRVEKGALYVESTYNNTKLTLTDEKGNTLAWATSGGLGFKGAKKGTPFAAAKVGETLADKAQNFGIKDVRVIIKGVGSEESLVLGVLFLKVSTLFLSVT